MARPPRLELANGIYHVLARGNERRAIFWDDGDRRRFLELVAELDARFHWRILFYCLMSNHYHLLVKTPEPNLARGMRHLNGVYAQSFNRRHGRVGHLLQGRYGARLVEEDEHLLAVARYIVRNPVRAGLCDRPSDWRWSSQRETLGEEPARFVDTALILSFYGSTLAEAGPRYREHTEKDEPDTSLDHPLAVGSDDFIAGTVAQLEPTPGIPDRYRRAPRPALESLFRDSHAVSAIADACAYGYSLREIARVVGVNASTVSRRLRADRSRAHGATEET